MAKCGLTIELDDPDRVYDGGRSISGTVTVECDVDVTCNGLEVTSGWRTHGQGNVASGVARTETLFTGSWSAGERSEYRFELPIANWPSTYHGHYLNIDHYIDARAKIPWAVDPKASEPFVVVPACGPERAKVESKAIQAGPILGCVIGIAVLGFIAAMVAVLINAGIFGLFFLALPVLGIGYWFIRWFLPNYLLGEVEHTFTAESVAPGESIDGELKIRPRKRVAINAVTLTFQSREQCVSGSGSNRKTHRHVLSELVEQLSGSTVLQAAVNNKFSFTVSVPPDAPYSIDLDDNDLIWSATLRVDIPRWPDWVKEIPIQVLPSGDSNKDRVVPANDSYTDSAADAATESSAELTFAETAAHLAAAQSDRRQRDLLIEAVTGLTFELEVVVDRRLLYSGDNDPHVYDDGYAVWAHYREPEVPMVLYVPHELADEFEQLSGASWRGRGTIVGWDTLQQRLQVKVERPAMTT